MINHFECHSCISEKQKLFINLQNYALNKLNENVFDYLPLTFFIECDGNKPKQQNSKSMVLFMNAFYALDDIKKRTKKFYQKLDLQNDPEKEIEEGQEEQKVDKTSSPVDLFDDKFIFSHFYQNRLVLIKQHKKEEKEEKEAYAEVLEQDENPN